MKRNKYFIIAACVTFGVIVSVLMTTNISRQNINEIQRKQQRELVSNLEKGKFSSFEATQTTLAISNVMYNTPLTNISGLQRDALLKTIITFLNCYANGDFETFVEYKKSQGAGDWAPEFSSENGNSIELVRDKFLRNHQAMRIPFTNLPPTFKQRITKFDASKLEVQARRIFSTNPPVHAIAAGRNFTGSMVLKNESLVYENTPAKILEANEAVIWATFFIPCSTELNQKPGLFGVSAYWSESDHNWVVEAANSAMPPMFTPML